jgi:hypothetical protein
VQGRTLRECGDAALVHEPLHVLEGNGNARAVAGRQQVRQL